MGEEIVDAADVGVRDAAGLAHLLLEAFDDRRGRSDRRADGLQRHLFPQFEIHGRVNLAHAAAIEELNDFEAARDDLSG